MAKPPITRIMVLADGSERSFLAAALAIHLAKSCGAKISALAVVDTDTLRQLLTHRILAAQEMIDLEVELEASARQHLERLRAMALEGKVVLEQILVRGPWHTSALTEQRELAADLIVLPAFKSNQANRDLLCREYQKIIDEAPCPIMLVK